MKAIEVHAFHLRAELDAIDGRPCWLGALCDLFLQLWDYLLGDETQGIYTTEYDILVLVCGLSAAVDCMETMSRNFDEAPAVLETIARVHHAVTHIWRQVQDLYDDCEEVYMNVIFKEGE